MSRYVTMRAAKSYWIDEAGDAMQVIEGVSVPEHHPIDTGLLDATGEPIMRLPNPIGFGRNDEW